MNTEVPTIDRILDCTHRHLGVPPQIIKNTDYRTPSVTWARHVAIYLARKLTFLSGVEVAKALNVDHTTVYKQSQKVVAAARRDPDVMKRIGVIIDDIEKG